MFRKLITSLERKVYGPGQFREQARATRTLLKFCLDHKRTDVENIRACLAAIEAGEKSMAVEAFKKVNLGGASCFDDWFPPVVFPSEDEEYAWAVFEALVERWARMMRILGG
jgi:hypothetical protein